MNGISFRDIDAEIEGSKRQRFPLVIEWTCPDCGEEHEKDMTESYLSYPVWGEEMDMDLYCNMCIEVTRMVTVIPQVSLQLVEE